VSLLCFCELALHVYHSTDQVLCLLLFHVSESLYFGQNLLFCFDLELLGKMLFGCLLAEIDFDGDLVDAVSESLNLVLEVVPFVHNGFVALNSLECRYCLRLIELCLSYQAFELFSGESATRVS
jgi:hypothetical protein